jgi:2-polyprenyl-3-methyl-5-hydroxy-6-metoxy-1,4-benzoquinol methylase
MSQINTCRVCSSTDLEPVIDLGKQPWCNDFLTKDEIGKEPFYPLKVLFCNTCSTSQLDFTVKKEIMFGDHTYLSGITKSLSNHFQDVAKSINERFDNKKTNSILDIGSNDGTQLQHFIDLGWDVLGVESSKKISEMANQKGIKTLNKFFNLSTMNDIGRKFDVINAAGVFFHLEELHSVTEAIKQGLDKDGIFVVQFLYMKSIIENNAFDQIYHEHLLYYTLKTISSLLDQYDLEMFDSYLAPIHGGQMIGHVCHKGNRKQSKRLQRLFIEEEYSKCNEINTYKNFFDQIKKMKSDNLDFLENNMKLGKKIYGMGAPVKGNTLLNYFGIGTNYIDCLLEKNELRKGLFSPGMHIPIEMETKETLIADVYYVLAWNFKKEILKNNTDLIKKGAEFYFPINPKISA